MKEYAVFDYNFNHVGYVRAYTVVAALNKAKIKFPKVIAPMVSE